MVFTALLIVMVLLIGIYRFNQYRDIIRQLTWWERIYSAILYIGLFVGMIYGYSIVQKSTVDMMQHAFFEVIVLFGYTGVSVLVVIAILERLLPEKMIQAINK